MPIASASRFVLRWFAFVTIALTAPHLSAQSTSSPAADGFDPNVNGNVYALLVQPDGKILIGGSYSTLQPNGSAAAAARNNIARVLPGGQFDPNFTADVAGQVSAMVLQPNGQIVIGGKFSQVNGTARNRVARLNADGTLDPTFNPNFGGGLTPEVTSLALQGDGKVIVGGGFINVQPTGAAAPITRNRLARLNADGSLDVSFDPNASSMVLSLAVQPDGKILVGGGFTTLQPAGTTTAVTRNRIARLNTDGTVDSAFNPDANNAVSGIGVLPDGRIVIGGSFTTIGGLPASRVARLDSAGVLTTNFGGTDGQIYAVHVANDGSIFVGGTFTSAGSGGQSFVARFLPTGSPDFSFSAGPNSTVHAIATQPDGSVVIGGSFTTLRGSGVTPVVRNHVARVSNTGAVDTDFRPDANGRLRAVAVQSDGKVLVGGSFTSVGGVTHSGIVRLIGETGQVDATFNANVAGTVLAIVQQGDGQIVIGGTFTSVNGTSRFNIARLKPDGSVDLTYDPATDNTVTTLALQSDGKILAGGTFTRLRPNSTSEPVTRSNIARINANGSLDVDYKVQTNGAVQSIVVQSDGKAILGGAFTVISADSVTSAQRNGVARMNANGTLDTAFDPNVNGTVSALLVQANGDVVIGGSFSQMAPNQATAATARYNIARVKSDGALDTTFDPSTNGTVVSLLQQGDGKLLIGGFFSVLRPNGAPESAAISRRYIARINTDGTVDPTYNLNLDETPGNVVSSIVKTPSGPIVIGGAFTRVGTAARNRIARTTEAGALDAGFNADFNTAMGSSIDTITVQSNGSVIVGGTFNPMNGSGSTSLAGFFAEGIPNAGFVPVINGKVSAVGQQISSDPVSTQGTGFAWLQNNGRLRPGFTFPANLAIGALITAVVQTDGKVLVSGTFTQTVDSKESTHKLMRFNADGSLDPTFNMNIVDTDKDNDGTPDATDPDIDGDGTNNDTDTDDDGDAILDVNEDPNDAAPVTVTSISAIALQSDGKILIGGTFTGIDNNNRNNIARLNADGSFDPSLNANTNNVVRTIAVEADGKILLGGEFTTLQGVDTTIHTRNFMGRIESDGRVVTTFDPNFNGLVNAIVVRGDGKIYVGGQFNAIKPNGTATVTGRTGLVLLNADGTLDTSRNYDLDNSVSFLLAQPDGKLLVAGAFTTILDEGRNFIARLNSDGGLDTAFNPNPNGTVTSLTLQSDGKILLTGPFTGLQPNGSSFDPTSSTPRTFAARLNPDGTLDPTFNPNFDNSVYRFATAPDGTVVAIGAFGSIQPIGSLLVGGAFSSVSGIPVSNLALFGRDGSVSSFQPNPNGAVNALATLPDGRVLIGGAFTTISGTVRNRLARFLASDTVGISPLDSAFNPNANGEVHAIAVQPDGKILVGGAFSNVGNAGRTNLARLNSDGSNDASFNPSVSGLVRSIALQSDGRILITYATGGGNLLVRLGSDGAMDSSFNAGNNGAVSSIAVQASGHIVVGGSFTSIGGGARTYLARLNANGSLDPTLSTTPNGPVTALAVQDDGKILIGGTFSQVDGLPRFGLARIAAPAAAVDAFSTDAGRTSLTWTRAGGAPEISGALFEVSTDASTWTTAGEATRVGGTGNSWRVSGLNLGTSSTLFVRARGIVPATPGSSTGVITSQAQFYVGGATATPSIPVITSATAVNGAAGSSFGYVIGASGTPTGFAASGLPTGLSLNSATGLISGIPTQQGTFSVTLTATNALGSGSAILNLFIGAPGSIVDTGRVVNLSVLAPVSAANPVIAGFVITGTGTQPILVRAIGPGLTAVGVNNGLAMPRLRVFNSGGQVVHESNSWGGGASLTGEFARVGAFPLTPGSADAAVILTLNPGPYTLHVIDPGTAGGTALAEVYDALTTPVPTGSPHLANISARGLVATAGQQVTGGFVITGTTPKQMLIRGIGPGLAGQGVTGALSNPVVTLNKIGTGVIAQNDNWETPQAMDTAYPPAATAQISAAMTATGAFPLAAGSSDSALLVTLPPGVYTAQVGGSGSTTGAAMVEVYEVP